MPLNMQLQVSWEIKCPFNLNPNQSYDWLKPVCEMRGLTLYENGLRPFFKTADNDFFDKDDFEFSSYHILAYSDNKVIGCIRLLPLSKDLECVSREVIGTPDFTNIIHNFMKNKDIVNLAEVSRWVVHPHYQKTLIGYYLGYAVWALSNYLGYPFIANGGFKTQKLIARYGATYLSNAGPYYSEKYNDNIFLFYFNKANLDSKALKIIDRMSSLLCLNTVPFVATNTILAPTLAQVETESAIIH